jgi:N-methylhydantoinase B
VRPQIVRAACHYAVIALLDPALPPNDGLRPCIDVIVRAGSVVDPEFPAPVGNYIMSAQLIAELVLGALTQLDPARALAGSGGDASFAIGWRIERELRVHYELMGSAYGAAIGHDGQSGLSVHITNCRVTPIEIVESEFPVRVRRFELIADSGGAGETRGGLGYVREYEVLAGSGTMSVKSDMHRAGGRGALGGATGRPGRIVLNPGAGGERELPARLSRLPLAAGDVVRFERPGGGGCGDPSTRNRAAVRADLADGYISACQAELSYGLTPDQGQP